MELLYNSNFQHSYLLLIFESSLFEVHILHQLSILLIVSHILFPILSKHYHTFVTLPQSLDERSCLNSSYSILPEPSSSMSCMSFSMSMVISNSSLMMRISFCASIDPFPFDSPPNATNASKVSSSFEEL